MNDQVRTECYETRATQRHRHSVARQPNTRARVPDDRRLHNALSDSAFNNNSPPRTPHARAGQMEEKRRLFCRRVVATISLAKPALRNNDDALVRKNTSAMTVTNGEIVDRRPSNRAAIQAENERTNSTRIALSRVENNFHTTTLASFATNT